MRINSIIWTIVHVSYMYVNINIVNINIHDMIITGLTYLKDVYLLTYTYRFDILNRRIITNI